MLLPPTSCTGIYVFLCLMIAISWPLRVINALITQGNLTTMDERVEKFCGTSLFLLPCFLLPCFLSSCFVVHPFSAYDTGSTSPPTPYWSTSSPFLKFLIYTRTKTLSSFGEAWNATTNSPVGLLIGDVFVCSYPSLLCPACKRGLDTLLYDCSYSPRSKIRGQGLDLFFGTAFGAGAKKLDLARVLPN